MVSPVINIYPRNASAWGTMRVLRWLQCLVIAIDFVLFVLTFFPAFSGIGPQPGLADRLWGSNRFGGWRADVVWVFASSMVLFFVTMTSAGSRTASRSPVFKLSVLWLICFVVYAGYVVMHMMG